MYQDVIDLLKNSNKTLASAESFTGGLFASTITSYSGVSSFFKGGIVSYWSEVKNIFLGVSLKTIKEKGVISKECALEMVNGIRKLLNVDLAVSFTGNAGPSVMEDKPSGLVYIGFNYLGETEVFELNLKGSRNEVQSQAVDFAMKKIKEILQKN